MKQLQLPVSFELSGPQPIPVFTVTRSRAKIQSRCTYCQDSIDQCDSVWTESKTKSIGCCAACAISAAKLRSVSPVHARWIDIAKQIQHEIRHDLKSGLVPKTVASFAELHDYVDANMYGDADGLLAEFEALFLPTDEGHREALDLHCGVMNRAHEIVDQWIKSGFPESDE